MNNQHDLELNAYLDGEMSESQIIEFEALLRESEPMRERLRDLRALKKGLSGCYLAAQKPGVTKTGSRTTLVWQSVAAVLLLVTGFITGTLFGFHGDNRVALAGIGHSVSLPATEEINETRIVIHLTNPDQVVAGDLLDEVEQILISFDNKNMPLRIEVVSNGEGIGLLRKKLSQHQARIEMLAKAHENLVFVACQNTINRLRAEKGIEVVLLPHVEITDSGVNHVVRRQMEGWSYIRV